MSGEVRQIVPSPRAVMTGRMRLSGLARREGLVAAAAEQAGY
jgi:hypothetical protein